MDRTPFTLELKPAAAIAGNAGTGVAVPQVLDSSWFVVEEMYAIVENANGGGSALAGTAFPLLSGQKAADNTSPTMNMVTGQVTIGRNRLSEVQVPMWAIALPPSENGVLRTPIVVPPQTQFSAVFTNNCSGTFTATPRIIFKGYKQAAEPVQP